MHTARDGPLVLHDRGLGQRTPQSDCAHITFAWRWQQQEPFLSLESSPSVKNLSKALFIEFEFKIIDFHRLCGGFGKVAMDGVDCTGQMPSASEVSTTSPEAYLTCRAQMRLNSLNSMISLDYPYSCPVTTQKTT
jgi:hypothetical protein